MRGYPESPQTIGQHLKKRRLDLRLTQSQAARIFGITYNTLSHWEIGQTEPEVCMLPAITQFLGYSPYPAPTNFSEKIAALRMRLGLGKQRLADLLEADVKSVRNWESGRTKPLARWKKKLEDMML